MRAFDKNKEMEKTEAYNQGYNKALNGGGNDSFTGTRSATKPESSTHAMKRS